MTAPQVTQLPPAPQSNDNKQQFNGKADIFVMALSTLVSEINALATFVSDAASSVNDDKGDAEAARDSAQAAATMSAPTWSSGENYEKNKTVWAPNGNLYRAKVQINNSTTPPQDDPSSWDLLVVSAAEFASLQANVDALRDVPPNMPAQGAYTLQQSDRGRNVQMRGTLTIAKSLPAGFVCVVTNHSQSDITIQPASGVTLALAATNKTGSLTLVGRGYITLIHNSNDSWLATGAGLS